MRSAVAQHQIMGIKRTQFGSIPLFIQLAHKGFEKTKPEGTVDESTGGRAFIVSKDMLILSVVKAELLDGIDKIEAVYSK